MGCGGSAEGVGGFAAGGISGPKGSNNAPLDQRSSNSRASRVREVARAAAGVSIVAPHVAHRTSRWSAVTSAATSAWQVAHHIPVVPRFVDCRPAMAGDCPTIVRPRSKPRDYGNLRHCRKTDFHWFARMERCCQRFESRMPGKSAASRPPARVCESGGTSPLMMKGSPPRPVSLSRMRISFSRSFPCESLFRPF